MIDLNRFSIEMQCSPHDWKSRFGKVDVETRGKSGYDILV